MSLVQILEAFVYLLYIGKVSADGFLFVGLLAYLCSLCSVFIMVFILLISLRLVSV